MATETMSEKLEGLGKKVVRLRDKDVDWADIAEELEVGPGKAMLAYEFAIVTPKERFKSKNDEALVKEIAQARKDGLSWAKIMARADRTEGFCRAAFEKVTKKSALGDRIGKGGRYPGSGGGPRKKSGVKKAPAKKSAVKKAVKKSGAKKTAAKKTASASPKKKGGAASASPKKVVAKKVPIHLMNQEQITARLTGKIVTVQMEDGKQVRHRIKRIMGLSEPGGDITIEDTKGKTYTVSIPDMVAAT